jgi:nucleotide-binding universal stress UspA family protein
MLNIKRILCPIDFSDFSRHAFYRSVAIAKAYGATVTALHVVTVQSTGVWPFVDADSLQQVALNEADRTRALVEMKRFLGLEGPTGVPVSCVVTEAATAHQDILAEADRLAADLIVMGTHGRSGFERLLLGSVTEKILRVARPPVLTVGALPGGLPVECATFKRILCAVDFSDCSTAALNYACSLAERTNAELVALHVVEWSPAAYDPLVGPPVDLAGFQLAAESVGRERLHGLIPDSARQAFKIEEIVSSGKPHREILRIAEEHQSDLIVLGAHGRNPVGRILFGSTVEPVVRRSTCPVLTVRQPAPAAEAAA